MENINIDMLPKDGGRMLEELAAGNMVITRSKNDFLYILDFDGLFHMFSHTAGAPGGGQRQFPKDEKYTATVKKLADISDAVFLVEFDKNLNVYGVMSTAEDGILSMFPGEDRDGDGMVDFGEALDEQAVDESDEQALDEQALDEQALDEQALDEQALDEQALDEQALDEQALDKMGEQALDE